MPLRPIRFRFAIAALSALLGLAALPGCLKEEEVITTRIGIALGPRQNNWDAAHSLYGTLQASSCSLPYFLANAADAAAQAEQLDKMLYGSTVQTPGTINKRDWDCQAIILTSMGLDETEVSTIISSGVPVILLETPLAVDYTCLVTGDNAQAGTLAANFITESLGAVAPRVLILEAKGTRYAERLAAFRSVIDNTIDSPVSAPTRALGKEVVLSALSEDDAATINAIYTADDDLALGALDALAETATHNISVVVGCGGKQEFVELIGSSASPVLATMSYPTDLLARCVEIAYNLVVLGDSPTEKELLFPSARIDRTNASEYLDPDSRY